MAKEIERFASNKMVSINSAHIPSFFSNSCGRSACQENMKQSMILEKEIVSVFQKVIEERVGLEKSDCKKKRGNRVLKMQKNEERKEMTRRRFRNFLKNVIENILEKEDGIAYLEEYAAEISDEFLNLPLIEDGNQVLRREIISTNERCSTTASLARAQHNVFTNSNNDTSEGIVNDPPRKPERMASLETGQNYDISIAFLPVVKKFKSIAKNPRMQQRMISTDKEKTEKIKHKTVTSNEKKFDTHRIILEESRTFNLRRKQNEGNPIETQKCEEDTCHDILHIESTPPKRPERRVSAEKSCKNILHTTTDPPRRPDRGISIGETQYKKNIFKNNFDHSTTLHKSISQYWSESDMLIDSTDDPSSDSSGHDFLNWRGADNLCNRRLDITQAGHDNGQIFASQISASVSNPSLIKTRSRKVLSYTRSVSFSFVNCREYEQILSHNPTQNSGSGPSIGIGWNFQPLWRVSVDEFEDSRCKQQERRRLLLSKKEREQIAAKIGYSRGEIAKNVRKNNSVRNQRLRTVNNLHAEKIEFALENAQRRLAKILSKNKFSKKHTKC